MTRYKVNSPTVIADQTDNETVVVNMENGKYYSIQDVGNTFFQLLAQSCSLEEASSLLSERFPTEQKICNDLGCFLSQLLEEKVLVADEKLIPPQAIKLRSMSEYRTPTVDVFTDMQGVLLMDEPGG